MYFVINKQKYDVIESEMPSKLRYRHPLSLPPGRSQGSPLRSTPSLPDIVGHD
jgi:hypothetical protein